MVLKGDGGLSVSRVAVFLAFFSSGLSTGTWVSRLPALQDTLSLSTADVGLVVGAFGCGVMFSLVTAAGIVARFSSATVVRWSWLGASVVFALLAMTEVFALLLLLALVTGAMLGWLDVAMNAQAALVERAQEKPFMSFVHGGFSLGTLVGALLGALLARYWPALEVNFVLVAVLMLAQWSFAAQRLLADLATNAAQPPPPAFALPTAVLWPLALLALMTTLSEGVISDWMAILVRNELGASESQAALSFAAFALSMTLGRFSGSALIHRLGERGVLRFGTFLAAVGLALVAAAPHWAVAGLGGLLCGIGLANGLPLMFSRAANLSQIAAGQGVASIATVAYTGFLVAPPLVGIVGQWSTLRLAFVALALLMLWQAGRIDRLLDHLKTLAKS